MASNPVDVSTDPPPVAIPLRVFYFSILRPYMRLVERSQRNVLVDPEYNDVCLAVSALCVACFHFPEWLKLGDEVAAKRIRELRHFQELGDIANTQKHGQRQNAAVQVSTRARLAFIVNENGKFGFFRTEVMSSCEKWGTIDTIAAIGEFIEELVAVIGFNGGVLAPAVWTSPTEYFDECVVVFTEDSYTASKTDFQGYRLGPGGTLLPVEHGFPIALRMEVNVPEEIKMGKWTLKYDLATIEDIATSNNGSGPT